MNKIDYFLRLKYPIQIIEDLTEGGYTISIPDLPGCVTCCQRWQDIPEMIEDAGVRIPEPTDINNVEVYKNV